MYSQLPYAKIEVAMIGKILNIPPLTGTEATKEITCDQALFSFRSVKHSGGTGETKDRA